MQIIPSLDLACCCEIKEIDKVFIELYDSRIYNSCDGSIDTDCYLCMVDVCIYSQCRQNSNEKLARIDHQFWDLFYSHIWCHCCYFNIPVFQAKLFIFWIPISLSSSGCFGDVSGFSFLLGKIPVKESIAIYSRNSGISAIHGHRLKVNNIV